MKNYSEMSQEELEKELAEIVKKNYEKGVLLLDHNFRLRRLRKITEMEAVEDIDDLICIMRSMKHMPDMRKYFLKDTDNIEYRCIDIVNGIPVTVFSFTDFSDSHDKIMEMYFRDRCHDLGVEFGEYPIVQMINDKFIRTLAVFFYNDEPFLDSAEHDFIVRCEKAYGSTDVYLDAVRRLLDHDDKKERDNLVRLISLALRSPMKNLVVTHSPSIEQDNLLSGDMDKYYFDDAAKVELSDCNKELILTEENTNESLKFDVSKINEISPI